MKLRNRLRSIAMFDQLGPGLVTGAADDDPSGIATYSQAGAQFGFDLLSSEPDRLNHGCKFASDTVHPSTTIRDWRIIGE